MAGMTTQQPAGVQGPVVTALQHLVRDAATQLLVQALEAELQVFLLAHEDMKSSDGSQAVVRNGYLPPRILRTSVGGIRVRVPRTRDRSNARLVFTSALIPPYHRRSRLDERLTEAYLTSCLERDPRTFLRVLVGEHIDHLPAQVIDGVHRQWARQWEQWHERSLAACMHLCWWAGLSPRTPGNGQGQLLFIVGLYEDGRHELVFVAQAAADPEPEWAGVLAQLRRRGLRSGPQLAHAPRSPAFRRALAQLFPETLVAGGREYEEGRPNRLDSGTGIALLASPYRHSD